VFGTGQRSSRQGASGKLTAAQARRLINTLDHSAWRRLRNRSVLALIAYGVASVDAVIPVRVEDYYPTGREGLVRCLSQWQRASCAGGPRT
jgi:integrase/recombinase XerD